MARLKATSFLGILVQLDSTGWCNRLGHNTSAYRTDDGDVEVFLHGHHIITLRPNGSARFTMAGWPTVTTRDRLNQLLPAGFRVFQRDHEQWLLSPRGEFDINGSDWYDTVDYRSTDGDALFAALDKLAGVAS